MKHLFSWLFCFMASWSAVETVSAQSNNCIEFPSGVSFREVNSGGALVSWPGLGRDYVYQVSWREKNTPNWTHSPLLIAGTVQFRLTRLKAGTDYDVQVRSRCTRQNAFAPLSAGSLGFRTLAVTDVLCVATGTPSMPSAVSVRNVTAQRAVLKWNNLADGAGTVIIYGPANVSTSRWKEVFTCGKTDSLILTDLKPETNYRIRIRTLCNQCTTQRGRVKMSGWVNVPDFRTPALTPQNPPGQRIAAGLVYDAELKPVSGAKIAVNGIAGVTDARGRFFVQFSPKERSIVKAEHKDYMSRSVGFAPTKGDTVFCTVLLEKFTVTHTFDSRKSMLLGNTSFTLLLPENALINERTKQPYTGQVNACIRSARPGDPLFGERMPGGDFMALDAQNRQQILYSYGFFGCELRGSNGEALNLAPGVRARAAFQITEAQRAIGQPTVPLWHFDEATTLWKEEGSATRSGDTYIGEVSHFSSWNWDWPGPWAWVEGTVVNCKGNPLKGVIVNLDQTPAYSDNEGKWRGRVPANFPRSISINDQYYLPARLTEGQTYKVDKPINGNVDFVAVGYIEENEVTIIALPLKFDNSTPGKYEFSSDRQNWQASNKFSNLPVEENYIFWIREINTGCVINIKVNRYRGNSRLCGGLLSPSQYEMGLSNILSRPIRYTGLENYLTTPSEFGREIYNGLGFYNSVWQNRTPSIPARLINYIPVLGCLLALNLETIYPDPLNLDSLIGLTNLQLLEVKRYQITHIPPGFDNLVYFNYNPLSVGSALPIGIYNFKNLHELELGSISGIFPEELVMMNSIKILKFSFCNFRFPPAFWRNENIKSLEFDRPDNFTSLPKEVENLKNLAILKISYAQIATLPAEIGNMTNLTNLTLYYTDITSLPPEIANLKNTLQNLTLTGCPIPEAEKAKIRAWLPNTNIIF